VRVGLIELAHGKEISAPHGTSASVRRGAADPDVHESNRSTWAPTLNDHTFGAKVKLTAFLRNQILPLNWTFLCHGLLDRERGTEELPPLTKVRYRPDGSQPRESLGPTASRERPLRIREIC
jgi:hypothetical protein